MKRVSIVPICLLIFFVLNILPLGTEAIATAQSGAARRVKIIAFVDTTEMNSKQFFQTTYKMIRQSYGPRVEFVIRHCPRSVNGRTVAEAVYCAGDQFRQSEFLDALTAGNYSGDKQSLIALATQLRMNTATFSECLERGKKRPFVEADLTEAQDIGLRGVPVFFIHGTTLIGAQPFSAFRSLIDQQLQTTTRSPFKIQIIYNNQFKLDDPHKYFSWLNTYFFPESELSLISHRSPEGQKLIKEVGARGLPVVLFSREVELSPQFRNFQNDLEKRGNLYMLKPERYNGILEFFEAPAVGNNPVKGNNKAPVTVMEFSDFECPTCGHFASTTLPKLMEKYVKTGQARIVFRNYPLKNLHPNAEGAAIAAECAHKAGIFWKYHDKLFENAKSLEKPNLIKYAESLGQNEKSFSDCLNSAEARSEVEKDLQDGLKYGVVFTPTLLINSFRVSGADIQSVHAIIDMLLRKHGGKNEVQTSKK